MGGEKSGILPNCRDIRHKPILRKIQLHMHQQLALIKMPSLLCIFFSTFKNVVQHGVRRGPFDKVETGRRVLRPRLLTCIVARPSL